jgi:hypothetical protein
MINEVNEDSMEEDYEDEGSTEEDNNEKSNNAEDKNADIVRTRISGFFVSSPDNGCKGGIGSMIGGSGSIDPQSLCGIDNNDSNNNYAQCKACIGRDGLSLFPHNCKWFVYSTRESEDTIVVCFKSVVGSWERDANWILQTFLMIQGVP